MANITDKITDIRNAARPNSARVSAPRSSGGATLTCDNLVGWPTASKVHFVTYKIDANSDPVAGTQLDCYGIVSGNSIGSFTVVDGSDTGHAVNDVVEMLPTAAWGQDLADALTVGHLRTGAHVSALPLTSPVLTTPFIADHTNATHTHATTAQGGQLGFSALLSTIFSGQVLTQANAGTAGGTMYYINLGGIKLCWGTSASQATQSGNASYTATYPTSFFTTIQATTVTTTNMTNVVSQYASIVANTATTLTVNMTCTTNASTSQFSWITIGT